MFLLKLLILFLQVFHPAPPYTGIHPRLNDVRHTPYEIPRKFTNIIDESNVKVPPAQSQWYVVIQPNKI